MKKIVIGNWKMNPASRKEAKDIFEEINLSVGSFTRVVSVVCLPFIYTSEFCLLAKTKILIGAQDCFIGDVGPYTGEISAGMLKSIGVHYVILGHSERRAMGEVDEVIREKVKSALQHKLKVVLCVGERARNETPEFLSVIKQQLAADLSGLGKNYLKNLIVAYEPIWAIGKGAIRPASAEDVTEVSIFIKKILTEIFGREVGIKIPIIYGGSVDEKNCREFLHNGGIDGFLVGRASLEPKKFVGIIKVAHEI